MDSDLSRDEQMALRYLMEVKDEILLLRDEQIALLKNQAEQLERELKMLRKELENHKVDQASVVLKPPVSKIKYGRWMPKLIASCSAMAGRSVVPDPCMFRLWLGIPTFAVQSTLTGDQIDNLFFKLRQEGFADASMAPIGHCSLAKKRCSLSRFTGFHA
jgi:hypothetical protein